MLAFEVPFYIELPALGMVGLILWWLLKRENRADDDVHSRIDELEAKVEANQRRADEERKAKHAQINRNVVLETALKLIQGAAANCTCGSLDLLIPLIDQAVSPSDPT